MRADIIVLRLSNPLLTDTYPHRAQCMSAMNHRDLWLRMIAVATDSSGESAGALVDAPHRSCPVVS